MNSSSSQNQNQVAIRPFQYRDIEAIEQLCAETVEAPENIEGASCDIAIGRKLQQVRRWYGLLKVFSLFPNPCQYFFRAHVAEAEGKVKGAIQISPFNRTRSTWRIDRVAVDAEARSKGIGSMLLRHCFEAVLEARTWLLEVNVNDKSALALYRQNGFQPLAQITYWSIAPERLQEMASATPDLPNLLPVSNADAQLLYQLDTASMPPLVRQVFDRHIQDFKTSFFAALMEGVGQWLRKIEVVSGYVFEPQRKAAIGYFQVQLSRNGQGPHVAQLTVHPAYTWLYPELLSQMARLVQDFPQQSLQLVSADYQPEREAYLEQFGAVRQSHSLLMSRSVWHKLRESKFVSLDGLQLSEVLQSFQPTRKPVPSRMSWLGPIPGEPTAPNASGSEVKPLSLDGNNDLANKANPLNFQNSEPGATDAGSVLPLKLPEWPIENPEIDESR
ncbi:MAG: GNAT family N-acetyltransferase [Oscillatoriaceae cyanobacterium Prado104]|jgi:ribosomal protein S18 acetylase RimI-like enzyme|nr:GNAT family N-acetyltransferase [Oscillatoriaceae cyanobacterium Prado104]